MPDLKSSRGHIGLQGNKKKKKKKCGYIIESLLTIPQPEKQPLCRIKVVRGPGKFNPLRLRPHWQNEPFANQC